MQLTLLYYGRPRKDDYKLVAAQHVGPHFCSMKITKDVREYAAQKEIDEQAALGVGMKEKAEEFVARGAETYQGSRG